MRKGKDELGQESTRKQAKLSLHYIPAKFYTAIQGKANNRESRVKLQIVFCADFTMLLEAVSRAMQVTAI